MLQTECNLIYPYFDNPEMLRIQVANWNSYPKDLRECVRIILVDDHSDQAALPLFVECTAPKTLLRFTEPGLWTMHEARNLGAFFSLRAWPRRWLLLSDIDMVITPETLASLLQKQLASRNHYTFGRVAAPDMTPYHPHPNSFLVFPPSYEAINGYDVDFCGLYGGGYGGDSVFAAQLNGVAPRVHLDDIMLQFYSRKIIPDAATTKWDRDEWTPKYDAVLKQKRLSGDLRSLNPVRRRWEQQL